MTLFVGLLFQLLWLYITVYDVRSTKTRYKIDAITDQTITFLFILVTITV